MLFLYFLISVLFMFCVLLHRRIDVLEATDVYFIRGEVKQLERRILISLLETGTLNRALTRKLDGLEGTLTVNFEKEEALMKEVGEKIKEQESCLKALTARVVKLENK